MELRTHLTDDTTPKNASPEFIKTHNALQDRINSFIELGLNVPVELLNGSHNMIASILYNNSNLVENR